MDILSKKDQVKDFIILSLIETIADLFTLNYDIDKDTIKNHLLNKLDELEIINTDINQETIVEFRSNIFSYLTNELSNNLIKNDMSLFNNYKICELIGSGSFANVYKVFNPLDNNYYAIKKIGVKNNFQGISEIRSMAKLNHKNIVRYHTSWIETLKINRKINNLDNNLLEYETSSKLIKFEESSYSINESVGSEDSEYDENLYNKFIFIQMELCKQNLKEYLKENKLNFNEKIKICTQIIEGIKYIHDNNIIHRDLKLTNIFISFDNIIKIGDFGLASNIYDLNFEEVGTSSYIAPEILENKEYDNRVDLYSLGVIILEIFGNFKTNMEKMIKIREINKNKCKIFENSNLNILISSLLNKDPNKRHSLENILKGLN